MSRPGLQSAIMNRLLTNPFAQRWDAPAYLTQKCPVKVNRLHTCESLMRQDFEP